MSKWPGCQGDQGIRYRSQGVRVAKVVAGTTKVHSSYLQHALKVAKVSGWSIYFQSILTMVEASRYLQGQTVCILCGEAFASFVTHIFTRKFVSRKPKNFSILLAPLYIILMLISNNLQ